MIYWSPIKTETPHSNVIYSHLQSYHIWRIVTWYGTFVAPMERKEASEQVVLGQASTYSDLLARAEMTSLFNTRLQEIAISIF